MCALSRLQHYRQLIHLLQEESEWETDSEDDDNMIAQTRLKPKFVPRYSEPILQCCSGLC